MPSRFAFDKAKYSAARQQSGRQRLKLLTPDLAKKYLGLHEWDIVKDTDFFKSGKIRLFLEVLSDSTADSVAACLERYAPAALEELESLTKGGYRLGNSSTAISNLKQMLAGDLEKIGVFVPIPLGEEAVPPQHYVVVDFLQSDKIKPFKSILEKFAASGYGISEITGLINILSTPERLRS